MKLKIAVIYGSVRTERVGIRAAKAIANSIKEMGHEATLIDPLEYKLPLLDKRYSDYEKGKAPKLMEKLSQILSDSDAYVIVSGEYNNSIPPALKNLLDHFYSEYQFKTSGIVTYSMGPFGGVRNLPNMRAIMGELGAPSIGAHFPIPSVHTAFDENGKPADPKYSERAAKFLKQLEWHATALKKARAEGLPK